MICPVNEGIIKSLNGCLKEINCPKYDIICTTDIWVMMRLNVLIKKIFLV